MSKTAASTVGTPIEPKALEAATGAMKEALIELRDAWNNGLDTPEQNERLMAKVDAALKLAGAP